MSVLGISGQSDLIAEDGIERFAENVAYQRKRCKTRFCDGVFPRAHCALVDIEQRCELTLSHLSFFAQPFEIFGKSNLFH